MATATVKGSSSTWVRKIAPTTNYAASSTMYASENATTTSRSFIYAAPSIPAGSVVSSATLTLYAVGSSGWGAVSLTKVTSRIADSSKTWNHQPTLGAVGGGAAASVTPSGTLADAAPITFDVTATVQAWVNGTANYGWQIRQASNNSLRFYSAKSAHPPVLTVTYTSPPDTPHGLLPAGNVSVTKPVVTFGPFTDPDGDALQALQVQVAANTTGWTAAGGFPTPTFDSGTHAATDPSLDLSTTSFAGFSGTTQYWTARVQDATGAWSSWADPVAVTVVAKPTPAFSSPSAGTPHVTEVTPQIVWTVSGQTSFRAQVLDANSLAVLADSGRVSSTVGEWGVPAGVIEPGGSYIAQVDVYDVVRSPSAGDPVYTRIQQAFTFVPGATATPTGVTVTTGPDWPGQVVIECTAATAPDYFTVYMDGQQKLTQVEPGTAVVSGTTYQFVIDHCPTGTHTFQVDAVTSGVASSASAAVSFDNVISGVWLGDPDRKLWALISTTNGVTGFAFKDNVTVTQPIDGSTPQQVIRGMGGLAGTYSGVMSEKPGETAVATREANLLALKERPQNTLRLVYGAKNVPVKVSNLSPVQAEDSSEGNYRVAVSFDFFQCGEFPFKPSL